jgi:hypothetical protein
MYQLENVRLQDFESAPRCFDSRELERDVVGPFAAIPRLLLVPHLDQN